MLNEPGHTPTDLCDSTRPETRQELKAYLLRYRHNPSRPQALAYGAVRDAEEAMALLLRATEHLPQGAEVTARVKWFLSTRLGVQLN